MHFTFVQSSSVVANIYFLRYISKLVVHKTSNLEYDLIVLFANHVVNIYSISDTAL